MNEITEYISELTEFDFFNGQRRIWEALSVIETTEDKRIRAAKTSLQEGHVEILKEFFEDLQTLINMGF